MSDTVERMLNIRRRQKASKPKFRRYGWRTKAKLSSAWRRPRGLHNKLRQHIRAKGRVVRVGFGSPRIVRGYHPSGVQEVLVHNPSMLDSVDGSTQAVRIAGGVGRKKRLEIQRRAAELGIRVLNPVEEPVEGEAGEDND
ncbi:50S ribosomal protein L32e [Methermicoccus shengliensis]|uniref:Large ribosomal subunit protein eL32 n=1 Tax=Methermicoccus shengliensis TaxID=660064 RepID=A0A832RXA1_9EURY|nr:50S ribosomal protein L32e [Methermicoccus shengliensis]KUK05102.1 MAG: Ribosomal protein L32 [Euryarchaeota archaeon 55_53]KUK30395.1 MAG: Ribosomal protein L32 [Methanosarcinales archeaon 56_1174]MDI3488418.1 large subunit ribosomal protein L32e [Methanosarcinales archaeon]MDN5294663.1 large subunit ribosomal protein L32e [Methanosarcinales archaeon]HIH69374.1 50S ribosomal protein L32e [Methermicoccus shengliensis]